MLLFVGLYLCLSDRLYMNPSIKKTWSSAAFGSKENTPSIGTKCRPCRFPILVHSYNWKRLIFFLMEVVNVHWQSCNQAALFRKCSGCICVRPHHVAAIDGVPNKTLVTLSILQNVFCVILLTNKYPHRENTQSRKNKTFWWREWAGKLKKKGKKNQP